MLIVVSMIRAATFDDIPALLVLERLCFTQDRLTPAQFRHFISRDNVLLLLALEQDVIVGYSLVLMRKNTGQARLYSLALSPTYQGSGIAKTLMQATEQQVRQRKRHTIILEVRKDNDRAVHFYKKLNYHLIGEYPNYYADHMGAFRFSKDLTVTEEL